MSNGWKEFWKSTFSYFTITGMTDAAERTLNCYDLPIPFLEIAAAIKWFLELIFVVFVIATICFPLAMLRMIWFTPRRFKLTVLAGKDTAHD